MTDDDYIHACWELENCGRFCDALAKLYYSADNSNRQKLRLAFQDNFNYGLALYNCRKTEPAQQAD